MSFTKSAQVPTIKVMNKREAGVANPFIITTAVLGVVLVVLAGFSVWAYANYLDQKNNVDSKIAAADTVAKQQQKDVDAKDFAQQEKSPTRVFTGPDDLGRVMFSFPKTWSAFIASEGTGGVNYEALLNKDVVVTPSNSKNVYAIRVNIDTRAYDDVLHSYQESVDSGKLKATPFTSNGQTGIRLDGQISDTLQGAVAIFKVRDKTLRITTESTTFLTDFNNIVLPSLKFNN